jgi:ring-1,2-phenylacetyl-CoA epoxidase subunit PaaE
MSAGTSAHPGGDAVDRIRTIPKPEEPVPVLAKPTLLLFVCSIALFGGSSMLAVQGELAWPIAMLLNAVCSFCLFTVSHEASHHAASSNRDLNLWIGRIATPFFAPLASFKVWRFIHMQHHRHTNEDDGSDPDLYTHQGAAWTAPLRWLTIDLWYVVFYYPKMSSRPRAERLGAWFQLALFSALVTASILTGNFFWLLVLFLIPVRLAVFALGWAFDWLPHHGLDTKASEDRFQATRNRIGLERLISPLMLYQNYHLVHHLHPVVPFYRYIAVWRRNEEQYLEHSPALSTVGGRPLTADEYRRLRELEHHHD